MLKSCCKKTIALTVAVMLAVCLAIPASARNEDKDLIAQMNAQFQYGIGPKTDGYQLDYRYFSPAQSTEEAVKYPLVIWLHGLSDGIYEGRQLKESDISRWASPDFQARFENAGAYILAPRSPENRLVIWSDRLIYTLRATIDDFIEKNKDYIDTTRIYIGGYSLGGQMAFKMLVAYPEMFAAGFPICPAWIPGNNEVKLIADIPIWLTSGRFDHWVNYRTKVVPGWNRIAAGTNVKDACRFSTLSKTAYPNGSISINGHKSWYSVNNDMFATGGGDYPYMNTVDANSNKVELTYPNGMISWLCRFASSYDGSKAFDKGNLK